MSLNRQEVVRAAVEVLDQYGLEDLTMRRLAGLLGVKAGALYWHVENKQTLLALVSDEILASPTGNTPDRDVADRNQGLAEGIRAWAGSFRTALLRHRDGAELVSSTLPVRLGSVDPGEPVRELLGRCGLSGQQRYCSRALVHFVLGHVTEEQTRSQLHELGVVGEFDARGEEEDFDRGLELLVTGVCALVR
ncbi:TetR/AcrR family transcriptional regulator C-terminal domain-containing protein [Acidipropionibacterium virtanenii]|uniref:Tetracycline repressor protein class E n=1 Tax=Acidipropionibacterium virtanenii TaxID=2057246 RepID=A0A344UVZ0_9ACTN|nr:TetR/AcrR family transcriptional regulator C-terminal domain-containing protein [Acidipropionibacterium virtanenii]AXE39438.1 Tetracycline repressor protein class E [Acidipropionibacterium virtanenii]